jgi:mevalonate kinase
MFKITAFNFEIFLIEKKLVKGEDIDRVLEEISSVKQKAYDAIKVEVEKSLGEMIAKVEKFIEELSTR